MQLTADRRSFFSPDEPEAVIIYIRVGRGRGRTHAIQRFQAEIRNLPCRFIQSGRGPAEILGGNFFGTGFSSLKIISYFYSIEFCNPTMKDRNVITPPLHKEAEFGELYKRYKARFESFAVGYVQDRLIAEDVVADAFIYYWENRSRLDADCNAAAYILTTIRHKCLNYLRALQVRMRVHNEVGDLQRRVVSENIRSLELCDPQHLFAGEIEKLVRDCMAEMPELTRQVFTARRIHGKSYREIAAECGITERRVETELEKALGKLREVLRDYLPLVLAAGVLERILR